MVKTTDEIQNAVIRGKITNTSNKTDSAYKTEHETKTAYIEPAGNEFIQQLKDFGMTEYESEDGNKFFIVKLVRNLAIYDPEEPAILENSEDLSSIETANWSIETKDISMNIIKAYSEQFKTHFFRLQALNVKLEDIAIKEQENPFV